MIKALILMELKGMRIYMLQIIVSLFVVPLSFLALILLNSKEAPSTFKAYLISGFIVISFVGLLLLMLSFRVSTVFEPRFLELYSTLPVSIEKVVLSMFLAYVLLGVPQTLIALLLLIKYSSTINIPLLLTSFALIAGELGSIAIVLGATIRNPYKVQAFTSILPWILTLLSPAYYKSSSKILLLNPITHLLNVLRASLALEKLSMTSLAFSVVLTIVLCIYTDKQLRKPYMLEKPF
jgi:ABC-2 type transport system permease protein